MGNAKTPTSTTERTVPAWLEKALQGLITQSTQGLQQFGAQGQNILQGLSPNADVPGSAPRAGRGSGKLDPQDIALVRRGMRQRNA